jgi:hypothetical protein
MPAVAKAMMETLFKGWFTSAVASTFVVTAIIAVIGGLCAFLLRRRAPKARVATHADTPAGSTVDAAVAQAGDA